ncbi:hypothetical protein V7112_00605 [Bacillus sp. JJ1566]|uniref:hypothetical protein n=1 Tax=Bacillus sp. JJ1566 TaxID=3122961 RepID=UPI0030003668
MLCIKFTQEALRIQMSLFELLDGFSYKMQELLSSNYEVDHNKSIEKIELEPYEARVYRLSI